MSYINSMITLKLRNYIVISLHLFLTAPRVYFPQHKLLAKYCHEIKLRKNHLLLFFWNQVLASGFPISGNGSLKQSSPSRAPSPSTRPSWTRAYTIRLPSSCHSFKGLHPNYSSILSTSVSITCPLNPSSILVNMRLHRSSSATSSPSSFNLPLSTFTMLLLAFPSLISASLDCGSIVVKDKHFDLSPLDGAHQVHWVREPEDTPGMEFNTTFTIDLCKKLKWTKGVPHEQECPHGTRSE